jgi:signal transduction histidine kinase/ActR/RegA family two-component response regulator
MKDKLSETQRLRFLNEQEALIQQWLHKMMLFGVILVPLFSIVDLLMYPEFFWRFFMYRFVATSICVGAYVYMHFNHSPLRGYYVATFSYYMVGIAIIVMIMDVGGYDTPYFAGLNLVFIGYAILMPINTRKILIHSLGLYSIYLLGIIGICEVGNIRYFLSSHAFVLSTIVMVNVASFVHHKLRLREFILRIEMEEAQTRLVKKSHSLESSNEKLEKQLMHSQKMEAVGRLAGGIAHDFNNLLTVVIGTCNLLILEKRLHDEDCRQIEIIRGAGERAAKLTRQLLSFSRKDVIQPVVLCLNNVLDDLKPMVQRLMCEDVVFALKVPDEKVCIKADLGQIEQVVMNLVVNARDAMPKGGHLAITLDTVFFENDRELDGVVMSANTYAKVSVIDTGKGIGPDEKNVIFDPFYTTKDKSKGSGLGLSIVYGIMKQAKGYVFVNSRIGFGSAFDLYFPICNNEMAVSLTEPLIKPADLNGGETIMVVEDEPFVRKLAIKILERNGYHVLDTVDPNDALEQCRTYADTIHLLLTDIIMPQMSGTDLAREILTIRPDIRILFMSGYTDDLLGEYGVLNDDVNFIAKPFNQDALIEKIKSALRDSLR